MDTSSWLGIVEFLLFSNMFKVMLCMELGDDNVARGSSWDNGWGRNQGDVIKAHINLYPPRIHEIYMGQQTDIYINYTVATLNTDRQMDGQVNNTVPGAASVGYIATITSEDPHIALPLGHNYGPPDNSSDNILILLYPNITSVFTVEAVCVGHASFIIQVTSILGQLSEHNSNNPHSYNPDSDLDKSSKPTILVHAPYRVTVIRRLRFVDLVFDWVITVIAALNSFSIGCSSDLPSLRMHFRHPMSMLLAASCQFIIMPTVSNTPTRYLIYSWIMIHQPGTYIQLDIHQPGTYIQLDNTPKNYKS